MNGPDDGAWLDVTYPTEDEVAAAEVLEEPTYVTYRSKYPMQYIRCGFVLSDRAVELEEKALK